MRGGEKHHLNKILKQTTLGETYVIGKKSNNNNASVFQYVKCSYKSISKKEKNEQRTWTFFTEKENKWVN